MEIVNKLYGKESIIIPHRGYDLLSGEFRSSEHHRYLGSKEEVWDPQKIIDEAKYVQFGNAQKLQGQLACRELDTGRDCRDREIWLNLYDEFTERRQVSLIASSLSLSFANESSSASMPGLAVSLKYMPRSDYTSYVSEVSYITFLVCPSPLRIPRNGATVLLPQLVHYDQSRSDK